MRNIKMLDCTLRDGGCVNGFNFGSLYMNQILSGLERSGIDIIEVGYIDSNRGSECERTEFCDEQVIAKKFLKNKKPYITYVAMVDYGKFDPKLLKPRTAESIDGIRLAFHKKDRTNMIQWGREILNKGYKLFVQPMTCLRYTDAEMLDLINEVNTKLPEATAFYIVDSFGEMRLNDLNRVANLVNFNLLPGISMGLHSHNNLQLSYSNAVTLLNFPTNRDLIFDSSIMGMGKGAGNMNTELFAEHLNLYCDKHYDITPLLETVDTTINQIRENYSWGYAIEYYLSAAHHCTPSYAGHFYKKHMLSVEQVAELLSLISEEKKISFDKEYADNLYYEYNAKNYDDKDSITALKNALLDKSVLLIAPGMSVVDNHNKICEYASQPNVVSIALNNLPDIPVDYVFASKKTTVELIKDCAQNLILTSNVATEYINALIVNYTSWTEWCGGKSDNALIVMMNILKYIGVSDVALAGFDGFTSDVDKNYYDDKLKRPVTKEQAERRNSRTKEYLLDIKNYIKIEFLTESMYNV